MPGARAVDAVAATRAMTVLHATEPPTVHLSLAARVEDLTREDIDRELYIHRSLVKQLAMRRTLFVFPRDLLPTAWASASARVAIQEAARLARSEEHTSELQSLMRISYAVFCLQKNTLHTT